MKRLGEVAKVVGGSAFPLQYQGLTEGDFPFLKVGDISRAVQNGTPFLYDADHWITSSTLEDLKAKPIPAGSTVFAKIGAAIATGRRGLLCRDALIDNNCFAVVPTLEHVTPKYIFWFLHTVDFWKIARATTIPSLRKSDVEDVTLSVPTLPVQDRLVGIIETLFSRLDATVASLERAKVNMKRARASVLKAAVEGRLVPTEAALARAEGRDYEPASVLLARILDERRARWSENGGRGTYKVPFPAEATTLPQLPVGWDWVSMDQLLDKIEAGKSFAAENTPPRSDQVGIVKVSAVTWGIYQEVESKTVHDPSQVNPAYFVRAGDLLFSRANTIDLVGAVVIAERVTRNVMLSDKILRLHTPNRFKRWVLWVLRSQHGRKQIESLATGNQESMRNIGQDRIQKIAIPFPPLAEQRRIVAEVDRRLSVLDALDATLDANLARCARLRQSILKRAFEGRLVPAEPLKAGDSQLPLFSEDAAR